MLSIDALNVAIDGKEILKGVNLAVNPGEIHVIMGPNGSGKSTLSRVIAGHPLYQITGGGISWCDRDLLQLSAAERAQDGIFMSFQYPVEIPGVTNINFLKSALNAKRKAHSEEPVDALEFLTLVREICADLKMDEDFLYRNVNEGFSGGEKKRNEILQMAVLQPRLAILDETDSGLDIDALRIIADGINALHNSERAIILVTHYQRLLNYITPDYIHVLADGKIVKSGDRTLALLLEEKGYGWLDDVEQA